MHPYRKLIALTIAFQAEYSFGHVDTQIGLHDGQLVGLPEQYQPAHFDQASYTLSVGQTRIVFPECIVKYFKEIENHEMDITASWYHENSRLPEYIGFEISSAAYQYKYNLLFDLNTLEPLWFQIWTLDNGMYLHDIKIGQGCMEAAKDATKDGFKLDTHLSK